MLVAILLMLFGLCSHTTADQPGDASFDWQAYKPSVHKTALGYTTMLESSYERWVKYTVSSGADLAKLFRQINANKTFQGDELTYNFIITTREPEIYLDETINFPRFFKDAGQVIFWGPKSKYRDNRFNIVCRKARTALRFSAGAYLVANFRISGCTDSAIRVSTPYTTCPDLPITSEANPTGTGTTDTAPRTKCLDPVSLSYVVLSNNTARKGGGVRVDQGMVMFSQSEILNNSAADVGGGVYTAGRGCVTWSGMNRDPMDPESPQVMSRLAFNWAPRGGGIFMNDSRCILREGGQNLPIFYSVYLQQNIAEEGGGMYVSQTSLISSEAWQVVGCVFEGNVAFQAGGALYMPNTAQIQLVGSMFMSNLAGQEGGGVWTSSKIYGTVFMNTTQLSGNQAGPQPMERWLSKHRPPANLSTTLAPNKRRGNGGAVTVSDSMQLNVFNCSFDENAADNNGGALYCNYCLFLVLNSSNFRGNTACSGGAVSLHYVGGPSNMTNCQLENNHARCSTLSAVAAAKATMSATASARTATTAQQQVQQLTCNRGGGGAVCSKAFNMLGFVGNTFVNNSAVTGGGMFINQEACLGMSAQCAMYIYRQSFTGNKAELAGGGIYFTSLDNVDIPIHATDRPSIASNIQNATMTACKAAFTQDEQYAFIAREFFDLRGEQFQRTPNLFGNNSIRGGGYGAAAATAVACLSGAQRVNQQDQPTGDQQIVVANDEKFNMRVLAYDSYGQVVSAALPDITLSAVGGGMNEELIVSGPLNLTVTAAGVLFKNLSVYADEYKEHPLLVKAQVAGGQLVSAVDVPVIVRTCRLGEVQTGKTCKSCAVDSRSQYSFNPKNDSCDTCPGAAKCDGVSIVPEPGFWHASPRSNDLHRCPMPDACRFYHANPPKTRSQVLLDFQLQLVLTSGANLTEGNVTDYNQLQCSRGYTGNVCGNCLLNHNGRFGRKGDKCIRCAPQWKTFLGFIGLKAVEAVLVSCMVVARLMMANTTALTGRRKQLAGQQILETKRGPKLVGNKDPKELAAMRWWQRLWVYIQEFGQEAMNNVAALVEILLMYIQMLSLLSTADVNWPLRMGSVFSVLRLPEGSVTWLAPDCMLAPGADHVGIFRIMVVVLSPAICTALLVGAWLLYMRIKQGSSLDGTHMVHTAVMVAVSAATFYYPSVTTAMMSVFTCTRLDASNAKWGGLPSVAASASGWWKQDYNVKCFMGLHRRFSIGFGVPVLGLVALGVPLSVTLFLWQRHSRGQLMDVQFQSRFGYMYTDFKESCWFWFCMRFWLLLALTTSIQGLSYFGPLRQLIVVAVCLSVFLILTLGLRPYHSTLANFVYATALYSTLVCVFLSFTYIATSVTHYAATATMTLIVLIITATLAVQLGLLAVGIFNYRKRIARVASTVASTLYQRLNTSFSRTWSRVSSGHGRSDSASTFRGMSSLASLQSQASHTLPPQGTTKSRLPLLDSLRSLRSQTSAARAAGAAGAATAGGDGGGVSSVLAGLQSLKSQTSGTQVGGEAQNNKARMFERLAGMVSWKNKDEQQQGKGADDDCAAAAARVVEGSHGVEGESRNADAGEDALVPKGSMVDAQSGPMLLNWWKPQGSQAADAAVPSSSVRRAGGAEEAQGGGTEGPSLTSASRGRPPVFMSPFAVVPETARESNSIVPELEAEEDRQGGGDGRDNLQAVDSASSMQGGGGNRRR